MQKIIVTIKQEEDSEWVPMTDDMGFSIALMISHKFTQANHVAEEGQTVKTHIRIEEQGQGRGLDFFFK